MDQSPLTSQPLTHATPHQSLDQQRSLEQPVMVQQQHCTTPLTSQPVSTSGSLTASVDLPDHQQYQSQKLSHSLPATVTNLDHSDQRQGQITNGTKSLSANLDQHASQSPNANQSLTGNNNNNTHQDQRTSSSLYQDMLELMQKRETELTQQVNSITADKERLQVEKTLLQQENNSSSKRHGLVYALINYRSAHRRNNSSITE